MDGVLTAMSSLQDEGGETRDQEFKSRCRKVAEGDETTVSGDVDKNGRVFKERSPGGRVLKIGLALL